jgi:hypothetical protein
MKVYDIPKSGKCGTTVAFVSRYGRCVRAHAPATKPRTDAQICSQIKFGTASAGWNYLAEDQRTAWRAYAASVPSNPQGGQSGSLTGQVLYTAINRNQAALSLPPYDYPPERPGFGSNPVVGFSITSENGQAALKLAVPEAPAAHVLVFASRPYNQGRAYCDKFLYLGLLPATIDGECDITAQYLALHRVPWPGSRVILRIVLQLNGWRSLPYRIEAIFPRP